MGLLVLLVSACSVRTLRVGTSGDYPPFSVQEEGGTRHGFDISVARAYARDRGLALEVVPFSWPELEDALLSGKFDVAMSGVTVRGDRLVRGPMTSSVARADAIVLVRDGRSGAEIDREGVVVAVNRGGHLEKLARARFRHATIRTVDDNQSLPALLGGRRVHAVVTDTLEVKSFEAFDTEVKEVLARDRKAYWVTPARPELALDLNQWIGARAADRWLETERNVWMDDPQRSTLPVDDAALVDHIAQRLMLMPLVAEVKRAKGLPVEAPGREEVIEEKSRAAATRAGLDPTSYLGFVRAEIEAAKNVQRAVLAGAVSMNASDLPDLSSDIRPAIDRIDVAIRMTLLWAAPVESSVDDLVAALRLDARVPGLDDESLRAIARAARAIPAPARQPTS
ncbi:MAG: transporter substrate-binding domain-containing protein [Candidatus Binatia bacterium]|nr:transporter substrate-binding domain-containing protein [Candidatus Binatia bacterium]